MKSPERTKARIIHSAALLFARYGFSGTSMSRIARKAGVNKASVYYHFRGKDTLYRIVLEAGLKNMIRRVHYRLVSARTGDRDERQLIETFFDYWRTNPEVLKLMVHEINNGAEYLKRILSSPARETMQRSLANIISILDKVLISRKGSESERLQRFISLVGMLMIYFLLKPLFREIFQLSENGEAAFLNDRINSIIGLAHLLD